VDVLDVGDHIAGHAVSVSESCIQDADRRYDRAVAARRFAFEDRSRLVDDIQEYLRDQIYAGRYPPGTRLLQEQIASELAVSRTPLREALRVLEHEGLLSLTRGNGVEVVAFERKRLLDALVLRAVVDGAAARIVAERGAGPRLRSELERRLAEQRASLQSWDRVSFARADADLHVALLQATENSYLVAQAALVRLVIQVFQMHHSFGPERAGPQVGVHEGIVAAVIAGDGDEAERRARRHIEDVAVEVREGVLSDDDAAAAA
jgi:DNA-binding GntR family transcriptional regulator